jgi:methionyl-tRNA formyltransferase
LSIGLREKSEQLFFSSDEVMDVDPERVLHIAKGEANSDPVFDWVASKTADYLILYGSSIIRERLLSMFEGRTINMHLGLSPYYRGSGTNFWPLVNVEPELVGVTIHLATLDVDAGAILKQVRPEIALGDRNHEIGCRAIIAGTFAMIAAIEGYDAGDLVPQKQAPGGKLYRRRDFKIDAVRKMWRNLDEGMITSYLAEPERTDRYPIVD